MKFTAMTDEQDFDGKMMPPFEVTGYLTCEDSEDFKIRQEGETCEWSIDPATLEAVKDKRHPGTNGVLPMTPEELVEFSCLFYDCRSIDIIKVVPCTNSIKICFVRPKQTFKLDAIFTENFKAILYLAERFELNGGE